VATKLPLGETEAAIDRHRAELAHLDEVDAALTAEIAADEAQLRVLNQQRQTALARGPTVPRTDISAVADPEIRPRGYPQPSPGAIDCGNQCLK
jgi:hypothetical protein